MTSFDVTGISLINNLKQKREFLKHSSLSQLIAIEAYKKSTKITLLSERQIQIMQLNQEKERLTNLVQELKKEKYLQKKGIYKEGGFVKKVDMSKNKEKQNLHTNVQNILLTSKSVKQKKNIKTDFQIKYQQVCEENQNLKSQIKSIKQKDGVTRSRKPSLCRSTVFIQKNMTELDKVKQKGYELQAEIFSSKVKQQQLNQRIIDLEELLQKALKINNSMKLI